MVFSLLPLLVLCQKYSKEDLELRKKIGQMLIVGFRGTELKSDMTIYKLIAQNNIGGVILFDYDVPSKGKKQRNILSKQQLQKLCEDMQKAAAYHLFISIDQEGGKVSRLKERYGFPSSVSAEFLGENNKPQITASYAALTADLLKSLGINLNFAPCVDVNVNPECPVIGAIERSFSSNPQIVTSNAKIWIEEASKKGIVSAIKHFPGHGSSTKDTHKGIADVSTTYSKQELEPYRSLIKEGIVDMVMTSHIFNSLFDPELPATLSYLTLTNVLRVQFGFNGVIVSDDMAMGAIADEYELGFALQKAIEAGVNMFILSNNGEKYDEDIAFKAIDIIFNLIKSGKLNKKYIIESYAKIELLKARYKL
jgi:beta-N-acetylhexosaminidase